MPQVDWGVVDDLEPRVDGVVAVCGALEGALEVARPVEEGGVLVQLSQVHLVVQLLLVAPASKGDGTWNMEPLKLKVEQTPISQMGKLRNERQGSNIENSTEPRKSLGTWLREISSCSCLTFLPSPGCCLALFAKAFSQL